MATRRQTPKEKFDQIKREHIQKMGGQSSLFPSAIPEKATKKAYLALQSELRRLQRTLQEREEFLKAYEQRLIEREQQLERDVARFEKWREDDVCCYCEQGTCIEHDETGAVIDDDCYCDEGTCNEHYTPVRREQPKVIGDEVNWLEGLFKLKDKRK